MNIVLLGYRGTGKTAIAKILAGKLKRKVFCLDELIIQQAEMSIPRIVEEKGWKRFREIESKVVREVTARAVDSIIDCGGGVVLEDQNIICLKRCGRTVLLTAEWETILKRVRYDSNRPPLKEGLSLEEEMKQTLAERNEKYLAAADMVCDTTRKSPARIAGEVIGFFKKNSWI